MKYVTREGIKWAWPDHDEKLLQVYNWCMDIDYILSFVDHYTVCIQAGGATGVWPVKFAEHFGEVITLEPDSKNFHCLLENTKGFFNITPIQAALGDMPGLVDITVDDFESNNCGAYYTVPGESVDQVTIDSLDQEDVGLIQLDIEGAEASALRGAIETLKQKPVVVIEEKPLPHIKDHTEARRFLESLGYHQVGAIHRDVIFKC